MLHVVYKIDVTCGPDHLWNSLEVLNRHGAVHPSTGLGNWHAVRSQVGWRIRIYKHEHPPSLGDVLGWPWPLSREQRSVEGLGGAASHLPGTLDTPTPHWQIWRKQVICYRVECFFLFLAMLLFVELFFSAWTFSSYREQGLLSSCGARASHCGLPLLQSTALVASWNVGSWFSHQGSNSRPLCWQVHSPLLDHQRGPPFAESIPSAQDSESLGGNTGHLMKTNVDWLCPSSLENRTLVPPVGM